MKFFIDTANLEQIKEANDLGILDGVTTNPSLIMKEGIQGDAPQWIHRQEKVFQSLQKRKKHKHRPRMLQQVEPPLQGSFQSEVPVEWFGCCNS